MFQCLKLPVLEILQFMVKPARTLRPDFSDLKVHSNQFVAPFKLLVDLISSTGSGVNFIPLLYRMPLFSVCISYKMFFLMCQNKNLSILLVKAIHWLEPEWFTE